MEICFSNLTFKVPNPILYRCCGVSTVAGQNGCLPRQYLAGQKAKNSLRRMRVVELIRKWAQEHFLRQGGGGAGFRETRWIRREQCSLRPRHCDNKWSSNEPLLCTYIAIPPDLSSIPCLCGNIVGPPPHPVGLEILEFPFRAHRPPWRCETSKAHGGRLRHLLSASTNAIASE